MHCALPTLWISTACCSSFFLLFLSFSSCHWSTYSALTHRRWNTVKVCLFVCLFEIFVAFHVIQQLDNTTKLLWSVSNCCFTCFKISILFYRHCEYKELLLHLQYLYFTFLCYYGYCFYCSCSNGCYSYKYFNATLFCLHCTTCMWDCNNMYINISC